MRVTNEDCCDNDGEVNNESSSSFNDKVDWKAIRWKTSGQSSCASSSYWFNEIDDDAAIRWKSTILSTCDCANFKIRIKDCVWLVVDAWEIHDDLKTCNADLISCVDARNLTPSSTNLIIKSSKGCDQTRCCGFALRL